MLTYEGAVEAEDITWRRYWGAKLAVERHAETCRQCWRTLTAVDAELRPLLISCRGRRMLDGRARAARARYDAAVLTTATLATATA